MPPPVRRETPTLARWSADRPPAFPAGVPPHLRLRWRAATAADPTDLLDEAEACSPCLAGHLDGIEFESWRDSDDLLATVLEVTVAGRYAWLPMDAIRLLRLGPPSAGSRPCEIALPDGGVLRGEMPLLYPDSEADPRSEIRSGETTDWHAPAGPVRGLGHRVWLFDGVEIPMAECSHIEIRPDRVPLL